MDSSKLNLKNNGTTLLSLKCKEGLVVVSDKRSSNYKGAFMTAHNTTKQHYIKLGKTQMIMTLAGVAMTDRWVYRLLTEILLKYERITLLKADNIKTYEDLKNFFLNFIDYALCEQQLHWGGKQFILQFLHESGFIINFKNSHIVSAIRIQNFIPQDNNHYSWGGIGKAPLNHSVSNENEQPRWITMGSGTVFLQPCLILQNQQEEFINKTFEEIKAIIAKTYKVALELDCNSSAATIKTTGNNFKSLIDISYIPYNSEIIFLQEVDLSQY